MSYDNLYNLTPRAFWNAVDGHWLEKENKDRKEWVRCRWQTALLLNVHLPKKSQITTNKLIKFDWEEEYDSEKTSSYEETKFEYEKMLKMTKIK
tara:strand:+ start:384 stop:665 length:282 start_codon:yes stop_codon:yes gene_type:complete